MRNDKGVTFLLLVLLVLTAATSVATLHGQERQNERPKREITRSKDREGADFETQFPVADYAPQETLNGDKLKERKEKNKRYDRYGFVSREPSENVVETVRDMGWQERVAGLPVEQSTAVVVGVVLKAEAFLSNSKSGVYTESTILVTEIIKDDPSCPLVVGNPTSVDRPGGFVRYPNGHKELYRVFGMNMPRVSRRYILFLTKPDESQNYRVLTGYELNSEGVVPLDIALHFDAYKGMDEAAFLKAVRDAAK